MMKILLERYVARTFQEEFDLILYFCQTMNQIRLFYFLIFLTCYYKTKLKRFIFLKRLIHSDRQIIKINKIVIFNK